jgi:hypothetical protein
VVATNKTPRCWASHEWRGADTLRLGAGIGVRLWPGGDMALNAESVVAKPESEPNAWGVGLTLRQFW